MKVLKIWAVYIWHVVIINFRNVGSLYFNSSLIIVVSTLYPMREEVAASFGCDCFK